MKVRSDCRRLDGRLFHNRGPASRNARVLVRGTTNVAMYMLLPLCGEIKIFKFTEIYLLHGPRHRLNTYGRPGIFSLLVRSPGTVSK